MLPIFGRLGLIPAALDPIVEWKLMNPLSQSLKLSLLWVSLSASMLPSAIALGASVPPKISNEPIKITNESIKTSDGRPWEVPEFGMSLTPPNGWQILPNYRGKTLVLQPVPKVEKIKDYSKPIYNRNITVAVMHQPQPIDETAAIQLQTKLERDFGQAAGVTEFQVLDHRFIDYRQKADAILIYTAFRLNGFPMSQMHIFLSGDKNSALLTYTDLADSFQANDEAMTFAWNAMLSTELSGTAPQRYENMIYMAAGAGAFCVAAFMILILRRRSARRLYEQEEARLYRDDQASSTDVSSVTSLATSVALAANDAESPAESHVWSFAASTMATNIPKNRKSPPRASSFTAW